MALLVGDGIGWDADAELDLLECLLVPQDDARDDFRFGRVEAVLRRLQVLEMLDHQINELVVVEMSGGSYDDVAGGEAVGVGVEHGFALEFLDRLFCSQDRFA